MDLFTLKIYLKLVCRFLVSVLKYLYRQCKLYILSLSLRRIHSLYYPNNQKVTKTFINKANCNILITANR